VTHVVLPHEERRGRFRLFSRSPAEELIEQLPEIEVHLTGPGRTDVDPAARTDA
jgi:hypothetical protein